MDKLLRVKDLSRILNISEDRVYTLARENILPSVRLKRSLRFDPEAIQKFIKNGGRSVHDISKREVM